jgi:hypothetical protein
VKAVAMLTEVSLTDHFSGLGGEVMVLGPPGRDADSRCLRRAKRTRAGSFSSSSAWRVGDVGYGGDREPRAGGLDENKHEANRKRTETNPNKVGGCEELEDGLPRNEL